MSGGKSRTVVSATLTERTPDDESRLCSQETDDITGSPQVARLKTTHGHLHLTMNVVNSHKPDIIILLQRRFSCLKNYWKIL